MQSDTVRELSPVIMPSFCTQSQLELGSLVITMSSLCPVTLAATRCPKTTKMEMHHCQERTRCKMERAYHWLYCTMCDPQVLIGQNIGPLSLSYKLLSNHACPLTRFSIRSTREWDEQTPSPCPLPRVRQQSERCCKCWRRETSSIWPAHRQLQ